tara:strand:+ start:16566 stop:17252 length:687 start_codon:yes stop_codon:yes gene_type:complete
MIYKIIIFLTILLFSNLLNAKDFNYIKKQEIIKENKITYYVSDYEFYHDSIFEMDKNQEIEVLYFFSYNCPSCFAFKDYFNQAEDFINKKKTIRLEKIPLFLEKESINYYNAKLYFLRKILGFNNEFDEIIFNMIHEQGISIQSNSDVEILFENYAQVEEKEINKDINVKKLEYRLKKSREIAKNLKIISTPSIIIHKNGKRYLINASDSETPYNMLVTLIYILEYKK